MLWAYNFGYASELRDGVEVKCPVDPMAFTNTFNSQPQPFKASIVPRREDVRQVMQHEWASTEKDHLIHLVHLQAKMESMAKRNAEDS